MINNDLTFPIYVVAKKSQIKTQIKTTSKKVLLTAAKGQKR